MTTNTASNKPDFAQLVDQFGREIFAYLFRQLAGAVETEDCLQETFLRAGQGQKGGSVAAREAAYGSHPA
jgi:DNA-directed RNA polymerase specialized sigma24 family protein